MEKNAVAVDEFSTKNKMEDFKKIRAECLACNPLSVEALEAMDKLVYLDEEPVRKYLLCFAKKLHLYTEEKGFLIDRIVQQFKLSTDEAQATVIVKKCFEKPEKNISADVWMYHGYTSLLNSKLGVEIKEQIMKGKQHA